jgi:UDP-galactopyranose mutase
LTLPARDLLCFSQLRWDFVYQRPQHLMTRAARDRRVWYVEEPVFEDGPPRLLVEPRQPGIWIVRPILPHGLDLSAIDAAVEGLLARHAQDAAITEPLLWFYTPMALPWAESIEPSLVIYDCMDELSAFRGAPPALREREEDLLDRAGVVFTGGHSLYEAKRSRHPNVHEFPSAVDIEHFGRAREAVPEPPDQASLPRPRIGWFGVIDERTDVDLLGGIADLRPGWSFVLVGPVVKIDPATIPARPNLHLLGMRGYDELPGYIAGWDVAMMPFARNESTRFISPTKTPEYLAAGRPVVSTSIRDVIEPYERLGLVRIADEPAEFVAAIEASLDDDHGDHIRRSDAFLAGRTWDETWTAMSAEIEDLLDERLPRVAAG